MRGAHGIDRQRLVKPGIISADTGNTGSGSWSRSLTEDHPRGCGEHETAFHTVNREEGSSPRMRGAPSGAGGHGGGDGIIPADAGSTDATGPDAATCPDHPRGCGEHTMPPSAYPPGRGSSPRIRGAPVIPENRPPVPRIIPADAGSTQFQTVNRQPDWDHPRGCGEHTLVWLVLRPGRGSSPRMRGALRIGGMGQRERWIIPADAGSTSGFTFGSTRFEDHPRGCGEHTTMFRPFRVGLGSSPRMRGALRGHEKDQIFLGTIPADAGSTDWLR